MTTIGNTEIADSLIFSPNTANLFCGLILLSSYTVIESFLPIILYHLYARMSTANFDERVTSP